MTRFLQVMGAALEDPERATTSPLNHQTIFHVLQDLILSRPSGSPQVHQFSVRILLITTIIINNNKDNNNKLVFFHFV
jgi:hypothetical protein